jgi:LacI family transcriptional regulator
MREVARAAGVSVSTVANVLSRPSIVAPETRRRVEQAILGVGYVPSGPARQLRGLPSMIVGSINLDLANPFYAEVNRGIEDRLAEAGCLVLACSTDLRPEKEQQILALLQEQAVRGIIISPIDPDPASLLAMSRRGTPVVLLDHPRGDLDLCAVAVDNLLGGQLAAEYLLSLGHRRIAYLGGAVDPRPVTLRSEGVRRALAAADLDPDDALLHIRMPIHPPTLIEASAGAVERILSDAKRPTAVMCLNDTAALGVLHGLDTAGVRVPAEMSVLGYDDLPFAPRLAPPLTTVSQPKYKLGHAAADLLLDEARPGHAHREVRFRPSLVVRSTTAPPPRSPRHPG